MATDRGQPPRRQKNAALSCLPRKTDFYERDRENHRCSYEVTFTPLTLLRSATVARHYSEYDSSLKHHQKAEMPLLVTNSSVDSSANNKIPSAVDTNYGEIDTKPRATYTFIFCDPCPGVACKGLQQKGNTVENHFV